MPTPVAHTLCGYACYEAMKKKGERLQWKWLLMLIVAANLADLDYLPGVFIDLPNNFHHGMTHSIVFTLIIAGIAGAVAYMKNRRFWPVMIIVSIAYGSHVLMDFFTKDTSPPFGEQLLWPFYRAYFLSPISLFRDIDKGSTNATFFRHAFGWYNIKSVIQEFIILIPIITCIHWIKTFKDRKHGS